MNQNLPGLTPAWLLCLAAILAVFIGLGGEASQRGIYDFLKDFQGALTGIAAFGVAFWAARPVYRQLDEIQRQSKIQRFETLRGVATLLAREQRLFDSLINEASYANTFEDSLAGVSSIDQNFIVIHIGEIKRRLEETLLLKNEFFSAISNVWGGSEAEKSRDEIFQNLLRLRIALIRIWKEVSALGEVGRAQDWEKALEQARKITVRPEAELLRKSAMTYTARVEIEISKIGEKMQAALADIA